MRILLKNFEIRINIKKHYLKENRNNTQDNQGGWDEFGDEAQETKMREDNWRQYFRLQREEINFDGGAKIQKQQIWKISRNLLNSQQQNYVNKEHWGIQNQHTTFKERIPQSFWSDEQDSVKCSGDLGREETYPIQRKQGFENKRYLETESENMLNLLDKGERRMEKLYKGKDQFKKKSGYSIFDGGKEQKLRKKRIHPILQCLYKLMLRFMRDWLNQLEIFLQHIQYQGFITSFYTEERIMPYF
ncbi:unnamed protein product [Paramecium pentaurelia]|uniref:Uncharacterized protein n=1 Tax=Paramecium pentaurelia TaxID=43138 RepID=A0A8S1WUN5_9CILI|nr:unnamed protein product [Paramecium pentaurelia]